MDIKILDLDSRFLVHLAQPEAISTFPTIQYFIKGKKKMQMLSLPSLVMLSQCLMIIIIIVIIIVIGYIFAITSQTRLRTVSHPLLSLLLRKPKLWTGQFPFLCRTAGVLQPSVLVSGCRGPRGQMSPDLCRLHNPSSPWPAVTRRFVLFQLPTNFNANCPGPGSRRQPPRVKHQHHLTLSISYKSSSFLLGHLSKVI